jgi:hypothetical protein
LDCLVVVECEQALDVSHQRPDYPPNQYGDPDHRDERRQNRPHHNIKQSDPERPDLELVMAAEDQALDQLATRIKDSAELVNSLKGVR